ncbi:imidazole glycerol phosphate synthase subunit HisH [Mucisphaera calidilacus]|uniref:Imidazole glycerol phosphate synthase subunit HisH n=1 Tax=Mucisphaera calidilacus TaxID=2527982 RepID=A0A518BWF2_9BACT|nr:imidazole glycerol phosphate synthase subunit HisH [Mucisphaera calidilacus]QDU71305.1 Imidazole glycerol phosphate synthase subunit HisH 1 [Mucisphaera calidilacus]
MLGIVNYGMGNLRSVQKAVERVGGDASIVADPAGIADCERLILPGVGAFADGMAHLRDLGLLEAVTHYAAGGRPMLGICLGMQLLFDASEETDGSVATVEGLGLIPGVVRRFRFESEDVKHLKVPHMGWNRVTPVKTHALLAGLDEASHTYFVHGYYCDPARDEDRLAETDYGGSFCCVAGRGNLVGTQFHPEKSQAVGLRILTNFLNWQGEA